MRYLFFRGATGEDVVSLRKALVKALGSDASNFEGLGSSDFLDTNIESAVRRWQSGVGIIADGIVGPRCLELLGLVDPKQMEVTLDPSSVRRLFPSTKPANIERYLPYVAAALRATDLIDRPMVCAALGTIRAESEGFLPISEYQSQFNTPAGEAPFSSYDGRLGNKQPGDGARFRGRGFVQLTGRYNYEKYGQVLGIDLALDTSHAELANAPEVAALLLAVFLRNQSTAMRTAISNGDLAAARKLVNGGAHGLNRFVDVFEKAELVWPKPVGVLSATTRGSKKSTNGKSTTKIFSTPLLNARKDTADIRDRPYVPPPVGLVAPYPDDQTIKTALPKYTAARLILDQGQEGACTGFGLACVVNYLRWRKAGMPSEMPSVSPRMFYKFAQRYDEYEGESYEGSSCRGAIKGWFHHGVCLEEDWLSDQPSYGYANRATENTLGVYLRINLQSITDLQAAIQQVGAVYVSCTTHDGWLQVPSVRTLIKGHSDLPIINFDGRPSQIGGHAFALVGFNQSGFILQNSWGSDWGAGGFAVLSYDDWFTNGMDAWVVALGVPGVVEGRISSRTLTPSIQSNLANTNQWWSKDKAYQHSVILGNDGRAHRYLTEDEMTRTLLHQVSGLPDQWFRSQEQSQKRLVIIVHGGINSEEDGIKRARALGRHFIANGCYPIFIVWKTGIIDSLCNIIHEAFSKRPASKSIGELISDQTDLIIEKTIGRPLARPIWSEMKENAAYAFDNGRGGNLLITALQRLHDIWGKYLEIHLIGHSAGSIWLGHFLTCATSRQADQSIASTHLYAPACSVHFANQHYATNPRIMENLYLDILSDRVEKNDQTASIYRKSLLYLVSNALEIDARTPILGLSRVFDENDGNWDGASSTNEDLGKWRRAAACASLREDNGRLSIFDKDEMTFAQGRTVSASHGGFDNDISIISRTIERIIKNPLKYPIDNLGGF